MKEIFKDRPQQVFYIIHHADKGRRLFYRKPGDDFMEDWADATVFRKRHDAIKAFVELKKKNQEEWSGNFDLALVGEWQ